MGTHFFKPDHGNVRVIGVPVHLQKKDQKVNSPVIQKKDYKLALKRGLKIGLLEDVVVALTMDEPLSDSYC